ncbi:MAG TPA: winged helix-turn-helix domain-containing protein [Polyangiaceae bacterium]|nr:winged helix-turn-helix domain-containing protein [Polyangiaceae bacterium]
MNETWPSTFRVPVVECTGKEAWGIEHGRAGFTKIDAVLRNRPEVIINLDFAGVARFDSSCTREVVVNLLRKYKGVRCFFITGIANESVRENMDAAMLKSEVSVLQRTSKNGYEVLGVALKQHLRDTLDVVEKLRRTTSKEVADRLGSLALPACINRLRDLTDAGLIMRAEGTADSGGREFLFAALR